MSTVQSGFRRGCRLSFRFDVYKVYRNRKNLFYRLFLKKNCIYGVLKSLAEFQIISEMAF